MPSASNTSQPRYSLKPLERPRLDSWGMLCWDIDHWRVSSYVMYALLSLPNAPFPLMFGAVLFQMNSSARLDIVNLGQDLVLVFCSRCFTGLNILGWFVQVRLLEKLPGLVCVHSQWFNMVQQRHIVFRKSGIQALQLAVVLIQTWGGMYQERLPRVRTFSSCNFIPNLFLMFISLALQKSTRSISLQIFACCSVLPRLMFNALPSTSSAWDQHRQLKLISETGSSAFY